MVRRGHKTRARHTWLPAHSSAYVYLDDLPIAQIDRTTLDSVLHLYGDHLDTPRLATDSMGNTVWRWEGRAFGDTAPVTDPDGDRKHVFL